MRSATSSTSSRHLSLNDEGIGNCCRGNSPEILSDSQGKGYLSKSLPELRAATPASENSLRLNTSEFTPRRPSILSPKSWISLGRRKDASKNPFEDSYQIEYSVLGTNQIFPIRNETDFSDFAYDMMVADGLNPELGEWPENYLDSSQFKGVVAEIANSVKYDPELKPQRISQGSSGSYFIYKKVTTSSGYKIQKRGIFKPKDEEPYGPLSPKWSKWLHRTFFPCFFGRSCLIPNLGYISEAAACVLDRKLLSYIIPYTDIIYLESDKFYRSFWQRTRQKTSKKIGSFQVFLDGYVEAQTFLARYPIPAYFEALPDRTTLEKTKKNIYEFYWSKDILDRFQEELEKLVILDYLMRNTDRGADNWMIKVEWKESRDVAGAVEASIKIGAIDSGLAFPWKHPNEWRLFPYGWLFLPFCIIGRFFTAKTRNHFLPLLTSKYWWEQTISALKNVFEQDSDFSERMWRKQIAVLKGQAFNVIEALKHSNSGPLELTRRENLLIWDDSMTVPVAVSDNSLTQAIQSSIYELPHAPSRQIVTETTSLLHHDALALPGGVSRSEISGFDYNMTRNDPYKRFDDAAEVNTKPVVIERLEKVQGKRPVFTWC